MAQKFTSDSDVIAPSRLRGLYRIANTHGFARASKADQHRQIDPGNHFYLARIEQRYGEIGRSAAKQVCQNYNALALIDRADRSGDFTATLLHIVIGTNANRSNRILRPDDVFHRVDKLVRKAAMSDQDQTDHEKKVIPLFPAA